jgi:hypothetical protein
VRSRTFPPLPTVLHVGFLLTQRVPCCSLMNGGLPDPEPQSDQPSSDRKPESECPVPKSDTLSARLDPAAALFVPNYAPTKMHVTYGVPHDVHLMSIVAMPAYRHMSTDELRLEDYMAGRHTSGLKLNPQLEAEKEQAAGVSATEQPSTGLPAGWKMAVSETTGRMCHGLDTTRPRVKKKFTRPSTRAYQQEEDEWMSALNGLEAEPSSDELIQDFMNIAASPEAQVVLEAGWEKHMVLSGSRVGSICYKKLSYSSSAGWSHGQVLVAWPHQGYKASRDTSESAWSRQQQVLRRVYGIAISDNEGAFNDTRYIRHESWDPAFVSEDDAPLGRADARRYLKASGWDVHRAVERYFVEQCRLLRQRKRRENEYVAQFRTEWTVWASQRQSTHHTGRNPQIPLPANVWQLLQCTNWDVPRALDSEKLKVRRKEAAEKQKAAEEEKARRKKAAEKAFCLELAKVARGNKPAERICVVCMDGPREAAIVHGPTAHTVCCMACARALKARGETCPVCRARIDAVLQNFD